MAFDCDIDQVHGNINSVHDTPSHFGLPFCEVLINFPVDT